MERINLAIEILKQGSIVIFPTDTAFAIGCRIDNEKSVERLFALRKRSADKAVPVLVSSLEMAREFWMEPISSTVSDFTHSYWPGAVTIVYTAQKGKIPSLVLGGGETIGLRMPNHEIALNLITGVGVPLVGTSANFAGEKTPYNLADLNPELVKLVDLVVPGECSLKKASTVIDCTIDPAKIIRQGAIIV